MIHCRDACHHPLLPQLLMRGSACAVAAGAPLLHNDTALRRLHAKLTASMLRLWHWHPEQYTWGFNKASHKAVHEAE